MNDRELMQQALEALEEIHPGNMTPMAEEAWNKAITPLRERLAQPEQEPVAWRFRETKNKQWSISDDGYYISCKRTSGYIIEPLYTTPPQRKPLTEEEMVKFSQFLTDVVTAAGLLSHGKTDKALALRISEFAFNLRTAPPQTKPLTAEEIGLLTTDPRFAHIETPTLAEFARAVIAKATGEKK